MEEKHFYEHDPIKDAFYKSTRWRKCRNSYAQMQCWVCERCQNRNVNYELDDYYKQFIVHHKIYLDHDNINNPDIALNFKNLELVCRVCHNKEHYSKPVCADGYELVNGRMRKKGEVKSAKKKSTASRFNRPKC